MSRARLGARAALGLALLIWWLPATLVALAALLLDRARFWAVVLLATGLREVGAVPVARAIYAAEIRRCERRRRALAGKR